MRLVIATILAAAVATPAHAQYLLSGSYWWPERPAMAETQTVTVRKMQPAANAYAYAPGAYAYAPSQVTRERYSANPANDVYVGGNYVGSDPDPRIRESLRREAISESGGH